MTKNELIAQIREFDENATGLSAMNKTRLTELLDSLRTDLDEELREEFSDESNEDEEELTPAQKMAHKLREARQHYEPTVASSGNKSADNGDDIAQLLRSLDPKTVVTLAEQLLEMPQGELWAKYEKLNPGQQRMNAGNRIRGAIRRGDLIPDEVSSALQQLAA